MFAGGGWGPAFGRAGDGCDASASMFRSKIRVPMHDPSTGASRHPLTSSIPSSSQPLAFNCAPRPGVSSW